MKLATSLPLAALFGLGACGGSSSMNGSQQNAFTGSLSITSVIPAGTNTCLATAPVVFSATGVAPKTVTVAGGDCVSFTNSDAAAHQPASLGAMGCAELNAPAPLAHGASFTTVPLSGVKSCVWEDLLNPPSGGGGY